MAAKYGALNLSQGFPNFEIDPLLSDLVAKAMREGHNQYAPMPGLLPLREQISAQTQAAHNKYYDPDSEITITADGYHSLTDTLNILEEGGDHTIMTKVMSMKPFQKGDVIQNGEH